MVPNTSSKYVNTPERYRPPAAITRKLIFIWKERSNTPIMVYTRPHGHNATPDAVSGPWPHNPCIEYIAFFPVCVQSVFLGISSYLDTRLCSTRISNCIGVQILLFCLEVARNTSTWVTYFRETCRSRPGHECGIKNMRSRQKKRRENRLSA